jgi:hypothetical protein
VQMLGWWIWAQDREDGLRVQRITARLVDPRRMKMNIPHFNESKPARYWWLRACSCSSIPLPLITNPRRAQNHENRLVNIERKHIIHTRRTKSPKPDMLYTFYYSLDIKTTPPTTYSMQILSSHFIRYFTSCSISASSSFLQHLP